MEIRSTPSVARNLGASAAGYIKFLMVINLKPRFSQGNQRASISLRHTQSGSKWALLPYDHAAAVVHGRRIPSLPRNQVVQEVQRPGEGSDDAESETNTMQAMQTMHIYASIVPLSTTI